MKLSVIVPTSGNVLKVKETIISFLKQKLDNFDIDINIIENCSKNKQSKDLQNFFLSLPKKFKYFLDERPGSSEARNKAVQNTDADVVAFIDDDVQLSDTWIDTVYKSYKENKTLVFLGGTNLPNFTCEVPEWYNEFVVKDNDHWECHYLSLLEFKEDQNHIDPKYIWGLNSAIVRKKFIELGGYNPDRHAYNISDKNILRWAGDGDMGLADQVRKNKLHSMYKKDMLVYHLCNQERLTKKYFLDRSYMQGIISSYTITRNLDNHHQIKLIDKLKLKTRKIIKKILIDVNISKSKDIKTFKKNILNEYYRGFSFHQKEILKDKNLLDWIKRENYWNSDIREEINLHRY